MDNRIYIVLEWTPEVASLLQDRPSLLQHRSTSQGSMGDSEPPDICMRLVSFTLLIYSCMFIIIETLHDQSLHLKIASETPNHHLLGTRGPRVMTSQCMKLVLVSFTLIYMCIVIAHKCLYGVHVLCEALVYFSGRWF